VKPRHLAALVLAAAATSGCTNVLGELDGLPLRVGLEQGLVTEAVAKAVAVGWKLASALVVLLGFHCWYRATHGDAWISLLKDYLGGIVVCVFFLASMQGGGGPVDWIQQAGLYLGDQFAPGNHALEAVSQIVARYGGIVLDVVQKPAGSSAQTAFRFVEAWQYYMSFPLVAIAIAANTAGIFLMRLILHVAFVWLVAFYRMVGPLAVPFVILPQTRHVFLGWLRTFVSIALWPWLFALAERLALAIPYSTWIGTDLYKGDLVSGINVIIQGQLMFLALNVVFFFVYLGIPIAAHLLVSGAGRPFRGAIR
jgi:hypothetical protein